MKSQAFFHSAVPILPTFGGCELSGILCAVAKLGYRPPAADLVAVICHFKSLLKDLQTVVS